MHSADPPGSVSSSARNASSPVRICGSATSTACGLPLRLQHSQGAARPGAAAPPPRPLLGPDPMPEGRRPHHPRARVRPELCPVGRRDAHRQQNRLDADPRPHRVAPPDGGNQRLRPRLLTNPATHTRGRLWRIGNAWTKRFSCQRTGGMATPALQRCRRSQWVLSQR